MNVPPWKELVNQVTLPPGSSMLEGWKNWPVGLTHSKKETWKVENHRLFFKMVFRCFFFTLNYVEDLNNDISPSSYTPKKIWDQFKRKSFLQDDAIPISRCIVLRLKNVRYGVHCKWVSYSALSCISVVEMVEPRGITSTSASQFGTDTWGFAMAAGYTN